MKGLLLLLGAGVAGGAAYYLTRGNDCSGSPLCMSQNREGTIACFDAAEGCPAKVDGAAQTALDLIYSAAGNSVPQVGSPNLTPDAAAAYQAVIMAQAKYAEAVAALDTLWAGQFWYEAMTVADAIATEWGTQS